MFQAAQKLTSKIALKICECFLGCCTFFYNLFSGSSSDLLLAKAHARSQIKLGLQNHQGRVKNVLVVMPFKDRWDMTSELLDFVLSCKSEEFKLDVVLVNNNSVEEETFSGLSQIKELNKALVLEASFEFNFSKIINIGVKAGANTIEEDDPILILNNDIEFESQADFIKLLVDFGSCESGIMGCTLLYPDQSIQHLYAQPGSKIVATHPFKHNKLNLNGPWFNAVHKVPAVTGAVMIFTKGCYDEVGGFDENLPTVGQDIDFCMSAAKLGYPIFTHGAIKAIHYEGKTRGKSLNYSEVSYIYKKWGQTLENYPLLLKGYSRWSEHLVRSIGEGPYPWHFFV